MLCKAYFCVLLTGQAVFLLDMSLVCGRNGDSVVAATSACQRDKITRRQTRLFDNCEEELVGQAIEAGCRTLSHGGAVMSVDVCRKSEKSFASL